MWGENYSNYLIPFLQYKNIYIIIILLLSFDEAQLSRPRVFIILSTSSIWPQSSQLSIATTRPQNDQKYVPAVYTERRFEFRVLIFEKQTKILKLSRACWLRDEQYIKIRRQRAWRGNVFITCKRNYVFISIDFGENKILRPQNETP